MTERAEARQPAASARPPIRIRGLAKYVGPPVVMDGATRPREAWTALLRIAGLDVRFPSRDNIHNTRLVIGHVLRDVSVDIDRGSVVCLTGDPEASTALLQILAGAVPPTAGSVEIDGDVVSLIAVGDNLDARRTADENIRASRHLVDASPEETERYAAEVIGFAELEGFEHAPLRTYSTGMRMRLSVALALCGLQSIGLIDDVLAVGDIAFQQKCVERLLALRQAGRTLVVALSDECLVRQVATRVITLLDGRVVSDATPGGSIVPREVARAANVEWQIGQALPDGDGAALRAVSVTARHEGEESYLDLSMAFETKVDGARLRPSIFLHAGRAILFRSLYPRFLQRDHSGLVTFLVSIPTHLLSTGEYAITIALTMLCGEARYSLKAPRGVWLTISRESETPADASPAPVLGAILPWEIQAVAKDNAE